MKSPKPSLASRATIRSLLIACLPTTAVALIANTPALGAAFIPPTNSGLTIDSNNSTNAASTNASTTNSVPPEECLDGIRR